LGAFFVFRPFGKNNAKRPEGPIAIIYSGLRYKKPHNPIFRDALRRPVFHIKKSKEVTFTMEHRIIVVVSGGRVQNVFTTLKDQVEVDILDFDDNGARTADELEDMKKYHERVRAEQREIY
jgi:hypothetical protein